MNEYKKHRRALYFLVGALFLAGLIICVVKIRWFGFSLSDRSSLFYQIDAVVSFDPEPGRDVSISLAVPEPVPGYLFKLDENLNQNFYFSDRNGSRRLIRRVLPPLEGRQNVVCRFRLVPETGHMTASAATAAESVSRPSPAEPAIDSYRLVWQQIDPDQKLAAPEAVPALLRYLGTLPPVEKKALSPYSGSEGTADAAIRILAERGIPARSARCLSLDEKKLQQQPDLLLDVYFAGAWHLYRPNTGLEVADPKLLILQRRDRSLFDVIGGSNSVVRYSVTRVPAGADQLNRLRTEIIDELELSNWSLFSLPAAEQNRFKYLALLPLAVLLIVLLRNVIGIQTMGTFMPVLIAMAFLEMKLLPGLINFLVILAVGLAIRSWLSRLNLLMVPRISAVVVVVILLMQMISMTANFLNLSEFMGITFFPLIIIAWTIERASTIWEEDGARNTLKQLGASLTAAAACYLVLSSSYLQYLLYTFSELNLIILGIILLLGTYTGYRLTELIRFRPLVKE